MKKPTIFDSNENNKDFPKNLSNDFFFIVNSNEDVIDNHQDEIKNQINQFINFHNDIDFNIHFYYSKGFFESAELKYIYSSKMINDMAISSQINQKFQKIEEKLDFLYEINIFLIIIVFIIMMYGIYKIITYFIVNVKSQDL